MNNDIANPAVGLMRLAAAIQVSQPQSRFWWSCTRRDAHDFHYAEMAKVWAMARDIHNKYANN